MAVCNFCFDLRDMRQGATSLIAHACWQLQHQADKLKREKAKDTLALGTQLFAEWAQTKARLDNTPLTGNLIGDLLEHAGEWPAVVAHWTREQTQRPVQAAMRATHPDP